MHSNALASLSLEQLKRAVTLREKIEALEKELSRLIGGGSATPKSASPRRKGRMSAAARARISAGMKAQWAKRRGKKRASRLAAARTKGRTSGAPLKERIIQTLKATGKSGLTVKELAAKLGKSYGNINVWFHTTGKGIKEIKKVAPGKFAWMS